MNKSDIQKLLDLINETQNKTIILLHDMKSIKKGYQLLQEIGDSRQYTCEVLGLKHDQVLNAEQMHYHLTNVLILTK